MNKSPRFRTSDVVFVFFSAWTRLALLAAVSFLIRVQSCFGRLKRHDVDGCRKIALQTGAHLHNFHQPISSYQKESVTDWVRRKAKRWRGLNVKASRGPLNTHVWLIKVEGRIFFLFSLILQCWRRQSWPEAPADTNKIAKRNMKRASVCEVWMHLIILIWGQGVMEDAWEYIPHCWTSRVDMQTGATMPHFTVYWDPTEKPASARGHSCMHKTWEFSLTNSEGPRGYSHASFVNVTAECECDTNTVHRQ